MDDPWTTEAEALIERLEQDHPAEFFHTLRDLIDKRFPRGRGRRKGDDLVDDSGRLARVVELLRAGVSEDDRSGRQPTRTPATTRRTPARG